MGISESLLYLMGLEKEDVPEQRSSLYNELFPVIQDLVARLASPEEKSPQ
ncbi:MAG TPA: hypothetical protein VGN00_18905 [Puia sp.]